MPKISGEENERKVWWMLMNLGKKKKATWILITFAEEEEKGAETWQTPKKLFEEDAYLDEERSINTIKTKFGDFGIWLCVTKLSRILNDKVFQSFYNLNQREVSYETKTLWEISEKIKLFLCKRNVFSKFCV